MIRPLVTAPLAIAQPAIRIGINVAAAVRDEFTEVQWSHGRGPHCTMVALAVTSAVLLALALHTQETWWAAISAFVSVQASAPASLRRGTLRILGTFAGAALAVALSPLLVSDEVAVCLALFVVNTAGMLGFLVSAYGYAWLLSAITTDMVLLALLSDPASVQAIAVDRCIEVTIGTLAAMIAAVLMAPDVKPSQAAQPPGWSDLSGAQWPSVQHALRSGFGVMLVPLVWQGLALPNLSQTAVTAAAVMAVPAVSGDLAIDRQKITERAMHRLLGCLFGGVAGLACLAASVETLLPWLLMLSSGIWIAAHLQSSLRGIGYVGTQAAVVFICTLMQGAGPPASIWPGVERLAGITGGLLILFAASALTAPSHAQPSKPGSSEPGSSEPGSSEPGPSEPGKASVR